MDYVNQETRARQIYARWPRTFRQVSFLQGESPLQQTPEQQITGESDKQHFYLVYRDSPGLFSRYFEHSDLYRVISTLKQRVARTEGGSVKVKKRPTLLPRLLRGSFGKNVPGIDPPPSPRTFRLILGERGRGAAPLVSSTPNTKSRTILARPCRSFTSSLVCRYDKGRRDTYIEFTTLVVSKRTD